MSAAAAVLRRLDPKSEDEDTKSDDRRSRRPRKEDLVLNQYENLIALDVVAPEDIAVTFEGETVNSSIAGNVNQILLHRYWWPW